MRSATNKARIQTFSKKKEKDGPCFTTLKKKTTWKIKINDKDYKITLITHRILPKKQIYVNDILQESTNHFGDFKFIFDLEGQILTVSQIKKTTILLINKKPFYSFQELPQETAISKSKPVLSIDEINGSCLQKEKRRLSCKTNSDTVLDISKLKENLAGKSQASIQRNLEIKSDESSKLRKNDKQTILKREDQKRILKKEETKEIEIILEMKDILVEKKYKFSEEIIEEMNKMQNVLKPNAKLDQIVKDLDIIRSNIAIMDERIENFSKKRAHIDLFRKNIEDINFVYSIVVENIKNFKFTITNPIVLSWLLDLESNLNKTIEKLKQSSEILKNVKNTEGKNMTANESTPKSQDLCIICFEKRGTHACIPCGHLKYCETCINIIVERKECAFCRSQIGSVFRIFT